MCDSVCIRPSGSQMVGRNYWPKLEVKSYKMELLLRYVWRVVESDPNIDFKETLEKWAPIISKCGCENKEMKKSVRDKLICSLLKLWQSMGGGLTKQDISYLLLFIERTRTEKKRLNFLASFNRLKMRYKVNYLKEQEVLCVDEGCAEHLQELDNMLALMPNVSVDDAVNYIPQLQEKNGYCVNDLSSLNTMENDVELQINELERGDGKYMGMLTQADEMWSEMENAFRNSIEASKEIESTLSTEFDLAEISVSKWKEKCAIAKEDEKKELEINKELQKEIDDNTRQSQVLEQELVELSSKTAQVNKNLQNMKTDHKDLMKKLKIEKANYLKKISCTENEKRKNEISTQQKFQAYNEKILDSRQELAKCCKYFLQQSKLRDELREKAKNMNDDKIACAKRCQESKVLIESQKDKIISEINEMRDNVAEIVPAKRHNVCDCKSSEKKCNCLQCKQRKCSYCCCTDLKKQILRNIFKNVVSRLKLCICDVECGFVSNLKSVLQCNTSFIDEQRLLKTFLLDLLYSDLDISVMEGLQVTREKVSIKTRDNVLMCLRPSQGMIKKEDETPSNLMLQIQPNEENKDADLGKYSESKMPSVEPESEDLAPEKAGTGSQNEHLESGRAELGFQNEDLVSVKTETESQNEDLVSVKTETVSQNEDLPSVKTETESQNEDLESVKTETESQNEDLESVKTETESQNEDLLLVKTEKLLQNEDSVSVITENELQNEDLISVKTEIELQNEDLETAKAESAAGEDDSEPVEGKLESPNKVEKSCPCNQIPKSVKNLSESKSDYPESADKQTNTNSESGKREVKEFQPEDSTHNESEFQPENSIDNESGFPPEDSVDNESGFQPEDSMNNESVSQPGDLKSLQFKSETPQEDYSRLLKHDTEFIKCPYGPPDFDGIYRPTYNKKYRSSKENICMKTDKLVHPKTSSQGQMKKNCAKKISRTGSVQHLKYLKCSIIPTEKCNCLSDFKRNDSTPKKSRPTKKNTSTYTQCEKYNISSMYNEIFAKTKQEYMKSCTEWRFPYTQKCVRESSLQRYNTQPLTRKNNLPNYSCRSNFGDNFLKTMKNKIPAIENNIINSYKKCLQARNVKKIITIEQKCKGINTEMTCKNAIRKRIIKKVEA